MKRGKKGKFILLNTHNTKSKSENKVGLLAFSLQNSRVCRL